MRNNKSTVFWDFLFAKIIWVFFVQVFFPTAWIIESLVYWHSVNHRFYRHFNIKASANIKASVIIGFIDILILRLYNHR